VDLVGNYDDGKLKIAQDAILDRMVKVLDDTTPAASALKELAEAFSLLENATRSNARLRGCSGTVAGTTCAVPRPPASPCVPQTVERSRAARLLVERRHLVEHREVLRDAVARLLGLVGEPRDTDRSSSA
jgi:hypothetical protein